MAEIALENNHQGSISLKKVDHGSFLSSMCGFQN